MKNVKNILLLDADPKSAGKIINTLSAGKDSFSVQHAGGVTEGLSYLQKNQPDIVLLDGELVELGEFKAVQTKLAEQHIPCILLSDDKSKNITSLAEKSGAREYVSKSGITPSHLLKTIVSTLRLSETESRLNSVFEEYSGRISAFSRMMDAFDAGTLVVNKEGTLQYANARASEMMNDKMMGARLMPYLNYRPLSNSAANKATVEGFEIRASEIDWDGANCNLFIIENQESGALPENELDIVLRLLNALPGNWLLLKAGAVEIANTSAAVTLKTSAAGLRGKRIETMLVTSAFREISDTGGKSFKGALTLSDGSSLNIKYEISELLIGGCLHELLGFNLPQAPEITERPVLESTPLAGMGNFGNPIGSMMQDIQLMISCLSKGNMAEAERWAESAEAGAGEMSNLLGTFKEYATLKERKCELSEFSMKELVDEAMRILKPKTDAAAAEINISELPVMKADKKMVLRVLEQLLNNAIRFSRKDKKPVIDIGHDKYEGSYIFCIRDNGMGISRKDHARIFEPLEKLDASGAGNGLGLAVCKTIVEKHGGKIWVESMPGHGSNFYFTLG